MSVKICHASISELKTVTGKAGDQTGKEVCTRDWYAKPWTTLLRYKDLKTAREAAKLAEKLAKSNLVGYDQKERNTLYQRLKQHNFNVDAYISSGVKTETDCSAFVYAVYCCLIPSMRSDANAPTTSTMKQFFCKHGFVAYEDKRYLTTDRYLLTGDVLVKPASHTVMAISDGSINSKVECYPKCTLNTGSIVTALVYIGEFDVSMAHRKKIAEVNGIQNYTGTAEENKLLTSKLKSGTLIKP